jgi:thiosulfate dehydrogenase [quinone] large subunit
MSTLRRYVTPLAILAAAILVYLENGFVEPPESLAPALTVAFWVLSVVVLLALFSDRSEPAAATVEIEGPAFTRYLFSNTRAGLFWLPVRVFLGFSWLEAGLHKAMGPGWLDGGTSLLGFWKYAASIPEQGRPPVAFDWYRDFLNVLIANDAHTWFAYLITFGEIAVGVGLLIGCLTGVAAFFGALMNMSFLLAGSASTNPVLFTFGIGLILAWRVAGYYGVDRMLLPKLGVPWTRTAGASTQPARAGAAS